MHVRNSFFVFFDYYVIFNMEHYLMYLNIIYFQSVFDLAKDNTNILKIFLLNTVLNFLIYFNLNYKTPMHSKLMFIYGRNKVSIFVFFHQASHLCQGIFFCNDLLYLRKVLNIALSFAILMTIKSGP